MFGTRSHSPTAPAIERLSSDVAVREGALLLVAHGTAESSATAAFHAARIADRKIFTDVRIACLNGEPGLADTLADLAPMPVSLLPLLMSEGYSFGALQAQLTTASGGGSVTLHRPLGANQHLADLMVRMGRETCRDRGWKSKGTALVIAAHGTLRTAASSMTAKAHAAAIASSGNFAKVQVAFLEEPPSLVDVLQALSPVPTVVAGFFLDLGAHGGEDVPNMIETSRTGAAYCGPIGARPEVTDLILGQLRATGQV